MGPGRLLANVRSPTSRRFPHPIAVSIRWRPPGTRGAKRGEVVRTRTTLLQAHTHQFLGTFGGAGNGDYREELKRAIQVIIRYAATHELLPSHILVRLDGLYGNAAVLRDAASHGAGPHRALS